MSDWTPGVITACCIDGRYSLPGWVNGLFGLDWALSPDDTPIWIVHHLPTGYSVMAIVGKVDEAMSLVDLLMALGDWNFTDPDDVKKMSDAVQIARQSGFDIISPAGALRPAYPDSIGVPA